MAICLYMKILIPPTCFALLTFQSTFTGIVRLLLLPCSCPQHPTNPTQTATPSQPSILTCERFREVTLLLKATQLYTELALQTPSPRIHWQSRSGGVENGRALIYGVCWFPWCKYSHHRQGQVINCLIKFLNISQPAREHWCRWASLLHCRVSCSLADTSVDDSISNSCYLFVNIPEPCTKKGIKAFGGDLRWEGAWPSRPVWLASPWPV